MISFAFVSFRIQGIKSKVSILSDLISFFYYYYIFFLLCLIFHSNVCRGTTHCSVNTILIVFITRFPIDNKKKSFSQVWAPKFWLVTVKEHKTCIHFMVLCTVQAEKSIYKQQKKKTKKIEGIDWKCVRHIACRE